MSNTRRNGTNNQFYLSGNVSSYILFTCEYQLIQSKTILLNKQ